MDLNYLFYRQQIERSRADAASNDAVRKVHEELAIEYERQIRQAAGRLDGERRPFLEWELERRDSAGDSDLNATMAVAMTAREVEAR